MSLTPEIISQLNACAVPTVNSVMAKAGLGSNHMRNLNALGAKKRFVGRAVTLRAIPTREDLRKRVASGELPDLQNQAFEMLGKDDVLIIDAGGDLRASVFGDIMVTYAMVRGAAAIVIDGCASDREAISALDIPVFVKANAATSGSLFLYFAEINVPVGCDGVGVLPGDVIMGDGNGVVLVPAAHAAEIAATALAREEMEAFIVEKIKAGAPLKGTYPANDATRAEYAEWKKSR